MTALKEAAGETREPGTPPASRRLAMAIGGTTALDEIDRAAWEREIERSRLSKAVLAELGALCERVAEEAEGVAERRIAEEGLDARYLRRRGLTARANGCQLRLSRPHRTVRRLDRH